MMGGSVALVGAGGASALAGVPLAGDAGTLTPSKLAPRNTPVPFTATFGRPPELIPYETGIDPDGQPFAKYSLSQKVGQAQIAPGLSTTLAGYNGIFPGPSIRVPQGTRTEVRISNRLPLKGLLYADPSNTVTHLHGSASLPQYDGYANDRTAPSKVKNYHYPNWQADLT